MQRLTFTLVGTRAVTTAVHWNGMQAVRSRVPLRVATPPGGSEKEDFSGISKM